MKLLVTGANGQLGSELREWMRPDLPTGDPASGAAETNRHFLFVDREELDITNDDAVQKFFEQHKPDYCINTAAYTNVEKAEDEYEAAHAVNTRGAENIARACGKQDAILFHISTDFVFDGTKTIPYTEGDEPHPQGSYGRTKYEGELAVQEHCSRSFIVRTSWLYSSFGNNFVKTILRLCAERDELPVVADQYGSPTYARDLAGALVQMIEFCEEKRESLGTRLRDNSARVNDEVSPRQSMHGLPLSEQKISKGQSAGYTLHVTRYEDIPFGIYYYANDGEVSWFEFAQKIRDRAGLSCKLNPISASEYSSKVQRPAYSVLSTKKIQHTFGLRIPEWGASLEECLAKIKHM